MGSANTRFAFSLDKPGNVKMDGVIVPVFKKASSGNGKAKGDTSKNADASASIVWPITLDKALLEEINALANEEKFDGSKGKTLTIRKNAANKLGAKRLILVGLGEIAKVLPRYWEANVQKAVSIVLGLKDVQSVAILLPEAIASLPAETAVTLGVDAVYQATYKSMEAKEPPTNLKTAQFLMNSKASAKLEITLERAEVLAQARALVKDLVNHPANLKSTNTLVSTAEKIGKGSDIKVTVQKDIKWLEKNMPCFYTVARGSVATDPPKFITLRYTPKSGKAKKHVAIVGKSVIFDTGGYQVKPGDYMVTMKGDMTGGAVALATMQAVAALKPANLEITAYLAATPNKIDSDAMIPDSIVDTTCGKKVEIRHTDAEGRLTLIDAVAKAMENKPDEVLTVATLTGAASVAVGNYIALMGNDEALRDRIAAAGKTQSEPLQTLDVTEDDFDNIKSKLDGADIINTSQRKNRGAQTAAAFVMSGAPEGTPMAHMDIAGADMTPDEKATGIAVKTVVQYLLNEDDQWGGNRSGSSTSGGSKASANAANAKPAAKTSTAKSASKQPSAKKATSPKTSSKAASAKSSVKAAKPDSKKSSAKSNAKKAPTRAKAPISKAASATSVKSSAGKTASSPQAKTLVRPAPKTGKAPSKSGGTQTQKAPVKPGVKKAGSAKPSKKK